MKCQFSFVTTPTADSSGTCIILHFDDKRYMVGNLHEGYQRACVQNGFRLNRVNDMFLTGRTEWKNTGGILGMILTVADTTNSAMAAAQETIKQSEAHFEQRKKQARSKEALEKMEREWTKPELEKPTMNLHGSGNLKQLLATARRFIFRQGMPVRVHEYGHSGIFGGDTKPTWADHNIRVWAMSIDPSTIVRPDEVVDDMVSSAKSPLKRNFDDYLGQKSTNDGPDASSSHVLYRNDEQRLTTLDRIISDMFDSDWQRDALFETRLAEVQLPAAVFLRNPETHRIEKYQGPLPGSGKPLPDITVLVRRPWPGALVPELPETSPSNSAMSYIIKTHPQRGKFDKKAAQNLGIPPGPLYSQLANGIPVQNKNGETVRPEQVMGKTRPGKGFSVVEIPSAEYTSNLLARPEWHTIEVMEGIDVIVWNLGPGVADDESLQNFITEHSDIKHIISSPDYCANYLTMESSAAATIRHNLLDSDRFGLPLHNNLAKALPDSLSHCIIANRRLSVSVEPDVMVEAQKTPGYLNTTQVVEGTPESALSLARMACNEIISREAYVEVQKQDLPSPEAEIITLGTGSAIPSKYRNVSGTLVRVPGSGSYLLDCGEGTLGQLSRIYSPEELQEVLKDLRLIWISHMHCDHHLGLVSVIKAWRTAVYGDPREVKLPGNAMIDQLVDPAKYMTEQKRLFVASEPTMIHWLREYAAIEDYGYDRLVGVDVRSNGGYTHLSWNSAKIGFNTHSPLINQATKDATGLTNLEAVNVKHCNGAKAVALTFPTGFKVSYSGDCRPSMRFAKIGQGSTVLIHEATFDDELSGEAEAKNHTTTSEAIGVGLEMGARRIILTHFSQRYQKVSRPDSLNNTAVRFEESNRQDDPLDMMQESEADSDTLVPDAAEPSADTKRTSASSYAPFKRPVSKAQLNAKDIKIASAFDYMRIKVKDIMLLEKFTPAFTKLYEESPPKAAATDSSITPTNPEANKTLSRKESKADRKKAAAAAAEDRRKVWDTGRTKEATVNPSIVPTQDVPMPDAASGGNSGGDGNGSGVSSGSAPDVGADSDASQSSISKRHLKKLARIEEREARRKEEKEASKELGRRKSSGAMDVDAAT